MRVNIGSNIAEEPDQTINQVVSPEIENEEQPTEELQKIVFKKWDVNVAHKTPDTSLKLNTMINGKEVRALLDTGASICLITEPVVKALQLEIDKSDRTSIYGIGGKDTQTNTLGKVIVPITIGRLKFPEVQFHVVRESCIDGEMFIGHEFLRAYGLTVNVFLKCIKYYDKKTKSQWDLYLHQEGYKLVFHRLICRVRSGITFSPEEGQVLVPVNIEYPEYVVPESSYNPEELYLYEGLTGEEEDKDIKPVTHQIQGSPGFVNPCDPYVLVSSSEPGKKKISSGDIIGRVSTVVKIESRCEVRSVQLTTETTITVDVINGKLDLGEHLDEDQKKDIHELLCEHQKVISTSNEEIGHINNSSLKIQLYDYTPIYHKPRRFPEPLAKEMEEHCEELRSRDIIEPSDSPYNCRVLPIRKPDGSLRLCMDYRELNKNTVPDRFPMTNLTDSLYSLHGSCYFTTLDLVRGYYQLSVEPESREYTAFSTSRGHWQYKRMPFGLKNAPAAFQRTMQNILRDFSRSKVIVYLDDILIIEKDYKKHKKLVRQVLNTLLRHGIKIRLDKCHWFQREVEFLGHLVSENGIKKHPKYIEKIKNFPRPTNVKELRQFMGLVNWQRKFVDRCAEIGQPLFTLTGGKRSRKLEWTDKMVTAFEALKEELLKDIKLAFPDYSNKAPPLELFVDASASGIGACLTQHQGGSLRVILFDSHAFSDAQKRYSTIERELAAIRWGVKTFRAFLFGQDFIIHTDHQPLTYLHNMRLVDNRLARTLEDLAEFSFTIRYTPGRCNEAADALSRMTQISLESNQPVNPQHLPTGLKVLEKVPGGGDSLLQSLLLCYKEYLKDYGHENSSFPDNPDSLRTILINNLIKDPSQYGLSKDKNFMKQLKAMLQPGAMTIPEIIIAFAEMYKLTVCVHYGFNVPVVYQGKSSQMDPRLHLQCLAGVHYNPVKEIVIARPEIDKVIVNWCKTTSNYCGMMADNFPMEVQDNDQVEEEDLVNTVNTNETLKCQHYFDGAIITVNISGNTYCAMLDSGAFVNLIDEQVFSGLTDQNIETNEREMVQGIGSSESKVFGTTIESLKLGNSPTEYSKVKFLIIPTHCLDTCLILGLPFLSTVNLDMDFGEDKLYKENQFISDMGRRLYSRSFCSDDLYTETYYLSVFQVHYSSFPGISMDHLIKCQEEDRTVRKVKQLIDQGIHSQAVHRQYNNFKRHWDSLKVVGQILVKEIQGKDIPVISFHLLLDIVLNTHVQNAHIGTFKLYELIYQHFWHPSLRRVIKDACFSCSICQRCKTTSKVKMPPTFKIQTAEPFDLMAVDLVSLPKTSDGYVGLLVLVDHHTKWLAVAPIRNKRAPHIVEKLESQLFPALLKLPVRLLSDNGPEFNSIEFQNMTERLNILHIKTTAYKPSSNGAVERVNRSIIELLRSLVNRPSEWKDYLSTAVRTYNNTTHRETNISPSKFLMTREHHHRDVPII